MSRFVVILSVIFIATPVAFAKQPAKQQKLTGVNGSQRVSITGAVFTRDTSNPALGEAYRDPSGLIWGSVVTTPQGKIEKMTQYDAEKYCKSIGAWLPTREEFEQLAEYLGQGTASAGYDPYLTDGKTEILPGLANRYFWSASVYSLSHILSWVFLGGNGYVDYYSRNNVMVAVRCVRSRKQLSSRDRH